MIGTGKKNQQTALKEQDAFVEVLVVDPLTLPVAQGLAKFRTHPLVITVFAFIARITAAYLLMVNMTTWGAIFACIGLLLDGIDGKIARIRHKDEELHGTIDFLLDQIAFTAMGLGILIWSVAKNQDQIAIIVAAWLGAYLLLMAFTSTWNRLLAQNHMGYKRGVGEQVFTNAFSYNGSNHRLLRTLYNSFMFLRNKAARFRMTPYPTSIESEVVMFMVAPIFHYQAVIFALGVVLLVPDIFVTLILIMIRVLYK